MNKTLLGAALVSIVAAAVPCEAQTPVPTVIVEPVECLPEEGNGLVLAAVSIEVPGREIRTYFRREAHGDFYWVAMERESPGAYWAVLPVPEPDNHAAEYYVAVYEHGGAAAPKLAQTPVGVAPVTASCEVDLSSEQQLASSELVVGDTSLGQKHHKPAWWRCEGIVDRIDARGEGYDDDECGALPWWKRRALVIPLAVGTGGVLTEVVDDEPIPELSPVQP